MRLGFFINILNKIDIFTHYIIICIYIYIYAYKILNLLANKLLELPSPNWLIHGIVLATGSSLGLSYRFFSLRNNKKYKLINLFTFLSIPNIHLFGLMIFFFAFSLNITVVVVCVCAH